MYYTMIKHSGHLRTLENCTKHSPAARVFYISLVFSGDFFFLFMTLLALTRKSTKTDFARKLVPIQQTELLVNTRNRNGH